MAAFTEATLVAVLDSASTGRTVNIERMNRVGTLVTEVYAVGVVAPYAGKAKWVPLVTSDDAATAGAALLAAMSS